MTKKAKLVDTTLRLVPPTKDRSAHLVVTDKASQQVFTEIELDPGALERLLLHGSTEAKLKVYGVGKILGHRKIVESRTVVYPGTFADDVRQLRAWLAARSEPGWEIDTRVKPTDLFNLGGLVHLTYNVFRFEKP